MKDIKDYIIESTQSEDLQSEISLALKEFGSVRNGFKVANIDDIIDALYKIEFDYDEENSDDDKLSFVGNYIDTKYELDLYIEDRVKGKVKIKSFNVFEV